MVLYFYIGVEYIIVSHTYYTPHSLQKYKSKCYLFTYLFIYLQQISKIICTRCEKIKVRFIFSRSFVIIFAINYENHQIRTLLILCRGVPRCGPIGCEPRRTVCLTRRRGRHPIYGSHRVCQPYPRHRRERHDTSARRRLPLHRERVSHHAARHCPCTASGSHRCRIRHTHR